jgi:hypothetical protein
MTGVWKSPLVARKRPKKTTADDRDAEGASDLLDGAIKKLRLENVDAAMLETGAERDTGVRSVGP